MVHKYKNGNLNQYLNFWTSEKKEFKSLKEIYLSLSIIAIRQERQGGWSSLGNRNGTTSLKNMWESIYKTKENYWCYLTII